MVYKIQYKGETVDETTNKENAYFLLTEYNMAFHGGVYCDQLDGQDTKRENYRPRHVEIIEVLA